MALVARPTAVRLLLRRLLTFAALAPPLRFQTPRRGRGLVVVLTVARLIHARLN